MNISSTVHVFSDKGNATQKVQEYNKFIKDNTDKFKGTYTANDGTKVSISIDVSYIEGKRDSEGNIVGFKSGDNELRLERGTIRGVSMGAIGNDASKGIVGNQVVMDSESDYYSSAATVHHDVMHQLGLGDRYYDDGAGNIRAASGFSKDLMGLGPQKAYQGQGFEFKQAHFDNYGKTYFQKETIKNSFSNKRVDPYTIEKPE